MYMHIFYYFSIYWSDTSLIENQHLVSRLAHVIVLRIVYACSEGSIKHAYTLRLARATAANRQTVGMQINVQIIFRYLAHTPLVAA